MTTRKNENVKIDTNQLFESSNKQEKQSSQASKASAIAPQSFAGFVWLSAYFILNIALTMHNKSVLSHTGFNFPFILTVLHSIASIIGCAVCLLVFGIGDIKKGLTNEQHLALLGFSFLYTINIAISNVSMALVLLSFHQTMRSLNPAMTCVLEYFAQGKKASWTVVLSLIPVIVGVALACAGEYGFSLLGALMTFLGVVLSATKGVATNAVLVGTVKLHPFDLLLRMAFLCAIECLLWAAWTGELSDAVTFVSEHPSQQRLLMGLLGNATLAFALSYTSLSANKATSSLSMAVTGNVKQVVLILLVIWQFGDDVGFLKSIGIVITIIGGCLYTAARTAQSK